MSDYETVKFLGATVVSFNCGLGWNDEVSSLNVTLAIDTRDGDAFNPPETGFPVTFDFMGWTFTGLLERWTESLSGQGTLINVSVVDPRNLLDGVAVILDGYTATISTPNIINVYGYLENLYGFGGSGKNESGIPYLLVGQAILAIVNSVSGTGYGGPIRYKGISYGLDITNLPVLPAGFRVGGTTKLTLIEVLRDICDAAGCEMFFRLEGSTTPIIKLYTISRARIPNIGVINQFISQTSGAVSKEVGLEMVNDTCAKFLVGGKREDIFYQTYGGGEDGDLTTGADNTIWPYWGRSMNGALAYGDGLGLEHTFPIDVRGLQVPGLGPTYYADVGEMISVLSGYDTWVAYLWITWSNRYRIDPNGGNVDSFYKMSKVLNSGIPVPVYIPGSTPYFHSNILNPHFLKAINLGLSSAINPNLMSIIFGSNNNNILNNLRPDNLLSNDSTLTTYYTKQLYNHLHDIAETYFGKSYMVRVPSVLTKYDIDTQKITHNVLPKDSGWLESETIANAQANGMLASSFFWATDDQNKVKAFARFGNSNDVDFSLIPSDDLCPSADGNYMFVRCHVDPEFVFLDTVNYTDARAIITLPGIVQTRTDPRIKSNLLRYWLLKAIDSSLFSSNKLDDIINKMNGASLSLSYLNNDFELPAVPLMVGLPLESQVATYGPWYINTAIGKTEMEQDESLVPWTYGSDDLMNSAGFIKVQDINGVLQTLEYGAVEYPGVPVLQLGDQLLNVGPYITDISVDTSTNGVTTRYNMKSWSPRFGKLAKYTSDRFFKMKKQMLELDREMGMMQEEIRKLQRVVDE